MLRRVCFFALFGLMLCVGLVLADELKGKVKKVDVDKNVITLTVGDKDTDVSCPADTCKFLQGKEGKTKDAKDGIKNGSLKEGAEITIKCENKDGTMIATEVHLPGGG